MKRSAIHLLLILSAVLLLPVYASGQRQIPITVKAEPASAPLKSGAPLLLRVTIYNGLPQEIRFQTFALSPNSRNGETTNISLVDIYGDTAQSMSLFYARPKLGDMPEFIAGVSSHAIKPQASLSVLIDVSKWQIRDGWKAGKYKLTVRADNIIVDQYTTASVMSDLVGIEIK
jgi:hypothetical protein